MSLAAKLEDPFVPFGQASGSAPTSSGTAPNLRVIPASEGAEAFSPLHAGSSVHNHGASGKGSGTPTVSLQKEGDKITGIRVECACGQVIELACQYP